ncbi:MAG: hypothetical protein HC912_00440 [Saprospiraceae bacterium]|nr:hypothetical protein [Saprospiraceae bacterium]
MRQFQIKGSHVVLPYEAKPPLKLTTKNQINCPQLNLLIPMQNFTISHKLALLMILGWSLTQTAFGQVTHRVNNNPAAAAPFTTIQAAVDAAQPGDIILVEGSGTQYSGFTLNKQLTITGPGYFFSPNTPRNPVNQVNNLEARVFTMSLSNGCSGSIIQGLYIALSINLSSQLAGATLNNITIRRNKIGNISCSLPANVESSTGWLITQNYILGSPVFSGPSSTNIVNGVISNNFIGTNISLFNANFSLFNNVIFTVSGGPASTLSIYNNIFRGSNTILHIDGRAGASIIHLNNIYENQISSTYTPQISIDGVVNNITATNGNVIIQTPGTVFLGATGNTTDGQWQLKSDSPAIDAGVDGVDCGMFGGSTPYILSGIPPVPVITNMTSTGAGNNTTPLNVTISVTGNQ